MPVLTVPRGNPRDRSPFSHGWRQSRNPLRMLAALLSAVLLAGLSVTAMQTQAQAASNEPPVYGHGHNYFYAYLDAGESLDTEGNIGNVTDPDGTVVGNGPGEYGPAASAGVWTVHSPAQGINAGYDWRVDAMDAGGSVIPGRVWANSYGMAQTSVGTTDLQFWIVNDTGYLYEVDLYEYNGINSVIQANSVGVADADCVPTYQSLEGYYGTDCGDTFRVFFEPPAPDLPQTAQSSVGEVFVLPQMLTEQDLTVNDLTFAPTGAGSATGTFSWSMTERYNGAYWLEIDVDGDGSYDGDRDRRVLMGADGSGAYEHAFDGLDGEGNAASMCTAMNARVHFDKLGEVHVLQSDVEARVPGIEITRLNGTGAPDSTIYWDDTNLALNRANVSPSGQDGTAGVDSTGGVHGWEYDINSWGNDRTIDDWTYLPVDHAAEEITFGGSCLEVAKTSTATPETRPGEVVTYQVTATNTGNADYTGADPAVVFDDLTDVLDDGQLDADSLTADRDGELGVAGSLISWAGPLAAGESVTISYELTVAAGGNGALRNVAWEPFNPEDPEPPLCDPATEEGRDPVTGEPCGITEHDLPRLSIQKSADQSELPATGTDVTYTIVVTSEGPGDFTEESPATFTDDLSDVLDDADFVEGSIDSSAGEATLDGEELSWTGVLGAGDSATVSYTVTYTADGDSQLDNQVCIPVEDALSPDEACETVVIPGARLEWAKSVDPQSGASVEAGEDLTYTLTFTNTGNVAATVDTTDDLTGVLDDAELVDGPLAEEGLQAVLDGTVLEITGAVPAGETRTVTYTVVVDELSTSDGDGVLTNELACPAGAPQDCAPEVTENPVRALELDKVADPVEGVNTGDVVTYTVTVTNTGEGDYTQDNPAVIVDDMTGVLDDARYLDDAGVTPSAGELDWTAPELTWTGALAAGESVQITYSVEITNLGDHELANSAGPVCATDLCPPPVEVVHPLPYITADKDSDPEPGTALQAGDEVTYTLTWTNTGAAAGAMDSTDDLSGILDDAELTAGPVVVQGDVTADLTEQALRVEGELGIDETAVVTYTVTLLADGERGDNLLENVLLADQPQVECEDGECYEVPPPSTEHPIAELETAKSADPVPGTTVQPGSEVTYTLTFTSIGQAPVSVDHDDILSGVLDDAELVEGPTASDTALEVSGPGEEERIAITGSLGVGQTETVTYTVQVLPDGQRGDDLLGNFLVESGQEEPQECLSEDPNCTEHHVSDLDVVKSSDPDSGSAVQVGEEVTYFLTFTNTSVNTVADPVAVDHTDHLADVLDDASLTSDPAVDGDGVQAVVTGESIVITGAVNAGDSVVVSYTVTVEENTGGDEVLANVVAPTGEEPVCAEGSPLCTTHDVDASGSPGLPSTGANVAVMIALATLLLAAGVLIVATQRRRMVR